MDSLMDQFDDEGYAFHYHMESMRQALIATTMVLNIPEVVVPHEVFMKLGTEYGSASA